MTPDQYVESILSKYQVARGPNSQAERLAATVAGPLRTWANEYLDALEYAGSYAKETGVHGVSDVDLFLSLKSHTPGSLKDIYDNLNRFAAEQGWLPRQQNVSIGITVNATKADLVPGRIQAGYQNYHSLYVRKKGSWRQTNVSKHVDIVRNSGRLREIRAVKIWRLLHGLDFPSLHVELFTIQALSGRSFYSLSETSCIP